MENFVLPSVWAKMPGIVLLAGFAVGALQAVGRLGCHLQIQKMVAIIGTVVGITACFLPFPLIPLVPTAGLMISLPVWFMGGYLLGIAVQLLLEYLAYGGCQPSGGGNWGRNGDGIDPGPRYPSGRSKKPLREKRSIVVRHTPHVYVYEKHRSKPGINPNPSIKPKENYKVFAFTDKGYNK